jgi:hypothetical protein
MRTLLFGLILFGGVGCLNMQPVGPLTKGKKPMPAADKDPDARPEPVTVAAKRPVPPAVLITPGEVTTESVTSDMQKIKNELEYDQKNTPPPPKTAEISHIRGNGVE